MFLIFWTFCRRASSSSWVSGSSGSISMYLSGISTLSGVANCQKHEMIGAKRRQLVPKIRPNIVRNYNYSDPLHYPTLSRIIPVLFGCLDPIGEISLPVPEAQQSEGKSFQSRLPLVDSCHLNRFPLYSSLVTTVTFWILHHLLSQRHSPNLSR